MNRTALLGRGDRLTRRLLGLAAGSAVAVWALATPTGATGTVEIAVGDAAWRVGRTAVFAVGTLLLLASAAAVAYLNDGAVLSWAATFAPAFGYFVALFDPETTGGVGGVLAQSAFWALFVAAALGSVGYAVGRGLRERRGGAAAEGDDDPDTVWLLLVGRDRAATRQVLAVAAGLFVSTLAVLQTLAVTGTAMALSTGGPGGAIAALLALVGVAALQAYRNDGLVPSWTVVFAPTYAFVLYSFAGSATQPLAVTVFYAAELAAVAALLLGTGGFLVGAGARRFGLRSRDGGAEAV